MRFANVSGRWSVVTGPEGAEHVIDVADASGGRFGPPQDALDRWPEFLAWARSVEWNGGTPLVPEALGAPSPHPCQVFGIGLNYGSHADESGFERPTGSPPIFTKFPSCLTGPLGEVELPLDGHVDWEVELVAVIGRRTHRVAAADVPQHLAGYTLGQDISERVVQMAATPPQFSLGKSLPGYGPTGPWLTTLDEFEDPDDIELGCAIDGEVMQRDRTTAMISPVGQLVELLSQWVVLLPGDLVFTGTPEGVGMGRDPQRWLRPGETLTSWGTGLGTMRQHCVAGPRLPAG